MNPTGFLKIANDLQYSPEEAGVRTAVGRAYYAVFNYIRAYLAANNIVLPNKDVHQNLYLCVKNSGVDGIRGVGKAIDDLRGDRHDADYEMESTRWKEKTCELLVLKARLALEDFRKCEGQMFIDGARNYLVNIKNVPV